MKSKKHILFVTSNAGLYGANTSMLNLMDKLNLDGFRTSVIVSAYGPLLQELNKKKYTYKVIPFFGNYQKVGKPISKRDKLYNIAYNFALAKQNKDIITRWNVDVIHSNSSVSDFGPVLAKLTGKPHVWHIREMMEDDYNIEYVCPRLNKMLRNQSRKVICITEAVKEKNYGKKNKKNVEVIYNGFDIDNYLINKEEILNGNICNFLICGAVQEGKGQIYAVKMIDILVHKGITDVHLYVVGSGDADYTNELKTYVKDKSIEDYVTFIAFTKNIQEIRKNIDIALVCSKNEALGRVTIESMLGDILVIGADSGGTAEIIQDRKTGYLYRPEDENDLAEKVIFALSHKEEVKAIVRQAKAYAKENFDSVKQTRKIEKIY
ncbi:MAG: glycosyltransferase family 4 protein [Lachnospiraceae bacterium]|nr:glycosyltransferase family 4 protein [Lachnospiraceae bacterium]